MKIQLTQRFLPCLLILLTTSVTSLQAQGFLRSQGAEIVNDLGPFLIRSVGTGNWMIQEGYMMQSSSAGLPTHTSFRQKLELEIGIPKTEEFYNAWLDNHLARPDVEALKEWGFNSIRVALHYKWFTLPVEREKENELTWLKEGFERLDSLLSWCEENKIYLILDMHGAPGGQGKNASISDYDPELPSLWESRANQEKLIALWAKLAKRYRNNPWIGGYDLINETNWALDGGENENGCDCTNNDRLWDLQLEIIKAIRKEDRNHMVILEGNCWTNNYDSFEDHPLRKGDKNMVISFHKYWNNNDVDAISKWLDMRKRLQLPVWMGEGGENSNAWFSEAIALMEEHNIGWSWWPVKKHRQNNVLKINTPKTYSRLLQAWQQGLSLPEEETYQAVMDYADSHRFENCEVGRDVINALFHSKDSLKTRPFKSHHIGVPLLFADYDMGWQGTAYSDSDYANYHVSTGGERTTWNHGGFYRNDGVDIGNWNDLPFVGWTTPGEWMQYSLGHIPEGSYRLKVRWLASPGKGKIRFSFNDHEKGYTLEIPAGSPGQAVQTARIPGIALSGDQQLLRVTIEEGDVRLMDFTLERN